jgi:hypothetical protein
MCHVLDPDVQCKDAEVGVAYFNAGAFPGGKAAGS